MRKFLWVVAVGALVLALAAPAMALDFKFGSEYRVRFTTGTHIQSPSNVFLELDNDNPRSVQLRVRPRFDVSDDNGNITATLRLEIGDIEFGNGGGPSGETNGVSLSPGSARTGPGAGGSFGNDGVNVETKWAYMDWAMPFGIPLRVRAGAQPWFLPKGLIVDDDVFGVRAYGKYGIVSYEAAWYRLSGGPATNTQTTNTLCIDDATGVVFESVNGCLDGETPKTVVTRVAGSSVSTSNTVDNNYDLYGGKFDVAIAPWLNPGVYYFYGDNRVNCTGTTCPPGTDRVRSSHYIGFTATGKVAIVSYDFDFVYGIAEGGPTGAFPTAATGATVDVKGFAIDGGVHFPIGPVTLNLVGSYASGDKQDGGDSEAFPSLAASWNGPGGIFEMIGSGGAFDQIEFTQDSPVNLWTLGISAEYVPVKALWLRVGYAFAGFSRNSGNCSGAAAGTCFGPVYNGRAGKSSLGHEVHLRADYTIWTGFKLQAQAGWLIPTGDPSAGPAAGADAKTAAEYVFQMLYNF